MKKTTQEQEDKKVLKNWPQQLAKTIQAQRDTDGLDEKYRTEGDKLMVSLWFSFIKDILETQSRISFQEGVEAERKRVDDLFCEWCMENEFVDESEAQNFRKLLTPPINEKNQ
jgi:hypothetical protein